MRTPSLFEEDRLTLPKSIELSVESLRHYGSLYKHWVVSFSGGKDSSATVTLIADLIKNGSIPEPESLTILYAEPVKSFLPFMRQHWAFCKNCVSEVSMLVLCNPN